MITSGPMGVLPSARITAKLAANSPSMIACSPLNSPQRIWSVTRKAVGITIAAMSAAEAQGLAISAAADSVAAFSGLRPPDRQTIQTIIARPIVVTARASQASSALPFK